VKAGFGEYLIDHAGFAARSEQELSLTSDRLRAPPGLCKESDGVNHGGTPYGVVGRAVSPADR
jgi:hypothetical protein